MKTTHKFKENFLINSSDTGRFIVKSFKTGKEYFIEPIGDPHIEWGSLDPASKEMNNKKGWKKYKGSIEKEESLITKENGFDNIYELKPGESPLGFIEKLDNEYLISLSK